MPETILAWRQWFSTMFEDQEPRSVSARVFDVLLTLLIVANVTGIILESVEPIRQQFSGALNGLEASATAIFAVEYVLRVWACVDFPGGAYVHPLWGRLRYMRSFFALIDLVAVLPALIGVLGAADLRVLRLFRLLRMLKLIRHSTTFGLLWSVLREEARSIVSLLFVLFLTVTISGSLMHMLEGEIQPNLFTSIPVAMWWAVETLTTVGYGDFVPISVPGRILGGIVSIVGIGTLALFSGLITVGFIDQLKLYRERQARLSVAVTDGRSLIEVNYQTGEDAGRHHGPADTPAVIAAADIASSGRCPHCGNLLSAAVKRGDGHQQAVGH